MIRTILRGATLRRDAYLRMVLSSDGVADGLLIVASVQVLVGLLIQGRGLGVLVRVSMVLGGIFGWVILSGLIYLIGKHVLTGYGSFPGVAAAVSLAFPPTLVAVPLSFLVTTRQAGLIASAWMVACLWMAARVALDLSPDRAVLAAGGGWIAWLILVTFIF